MKIAVTAWSLRLCQSVVFMKNNWQSTQRTKRFSRKSLLMILNMRTCMYSLGSWNFDQFCSEHTVYMFTMSCPWFLMRKVFDCIPNLIYGTCINRPNVTMVGILIDNFQFTKLCRFPLSLLGDRDHKQFGHGSLLSISRIKILGPFIICLFFDVFY